MLQIQGRKNDHTADAHLSLVLDVALHHARTNKHIQGLLRRSCTRQSCRYRCPLLLSTIIFYLQKLQNKCTRTHNRVVVQVMDKAQLPVLMSIMMITQAVLSTPCGLRAKRSLKDRNNLLLGGFGTMIVADLFFAKMSTPTGTTGC